MIISNKYDKITIGTTGEYNQALIGPNSNGHPIYYQGLLEPPNKNAISIWEDTIIFKNRAMEPL